MKSFITLFVIAAFALVATNAQDYAVGIEIAANAGELPATCSKSGPQCASDCSTLLICTGTSTTPLQTVLCSSPTQYCVGTACSNKPSSECAASGPSFQCTDDAVFPEPSDCTRYRVCDAGVSKLYQCPSGFVFNSKVNLCQKGTTPCTKIDCSKATAAKPYIVYASNPAYYAYCLNYGNGTIQTLMFKCQYEQSEIFDATLMSCKFNCKAKGYFQDPNNCSQYFYCSAASAKPSEPLVCPGTYVFDGTTCNKDATKCQYPPPAPDAPPA